MAINNYWQTDPAINSPYIHAHVVTPSDTVDLPEIPRALYAHKGASSHCDVTLIPAGDEDPVLFVLARGEIVPVRAKRVMATGTDATAVVALY